MPNNQFLIDAQNISLSRLPIVPEFFHAITHFIYCRGQEVSMVLRRGPRNSRNVRLLKCNIEQHNSINMTGIKGNEEQVLVAGALLKEVLYSMKEPVMKRDENRIRQLLLTKRIDRQSNVAKQIVNNLPIGSRTALHHIVHLLRQLSDNCNRQAGDQEKSDSTTLSDEFADYLIRDNNTTFIYPYQHLQAAKFINLLIRYEIHAFGEWNCEKCPQRPDYGVTLPTLHSWYKAPVPPQIHQILAHIEINPEELHSCFIKLKTQAAADTATHLTKTKLATDGMAGNFRQNMDSCDKLKTFCILLPDPLIPKSCLDEIPNDPDVQSMKRSLEKLPEQHKYLIAHLVRSFTLAAKAEVQSSSPLLVALDWFIAQFLLIDNKYLLESKDENLNNRERQKMKKFYQILGFYRGTIDRKYESCNECIC